MGEASRPLAMRSLIFSKIRRCSGSKKQLGSIERSIGHLEFHFDKLTERAIRGLVRKDKERWHAARELVATLYPDRHVQDRVVSWFSYWCEHRTHLIERVLEEVEVDSDHFRIVEI